MNRYYEADQEIFSLMNAIRGESFRELWEARIMIIMDRKVSINKLTGRATLASIKCTNEVEKFLTNGEDPYDYFMFIPELVWEMASPENRKRILSHELCHCAVDDKGRFKVVPHDIEDFFSEIQKNSDDPRWSADLGELVKLRYDQMKEEQEI